MRIRIAEQLLFDLAAELRFVPVEERSRSLHLRALELKRTVREWTERARMASLDEIEAVIGEIHELTSQARKLREAPSRIGNQNSRGGSLTRNDRCLSIASRRTSQAMSNSPLPCPRWAV
jgi:hypothetical protein